MQTPRFLTSSPRLAYDIAGQGPPVVFLHGVGGCRQNWARQVEELRSDFTVIAWDARGYGDSDDTDGPREFSDFGDDLVRLLDELDIERAHLVGLSMGARILMEFYSRYADRAATMTLCDCFYSFGTALSPEKQAEYIELREQPLKEGKTFADLAPALIESLVSSACPEPIRDELRDSILKLRVDPYLKTLRSSVIFDQTETLGTIAVPVQLIFGDADQLTPPSIGEDMVERIPDGRLAVISGAGHLSNLERPAEFNAVLRSFLVEHSAAARSITRS